jgi:hypothetical protein
MFSTLPIHDDLLTYLRQTTMDNEIRTAVYGSPRVASHADRVSPSKTMLIRTNSMKRIWCASLINSRRAAGFVEVEKEAAPVHA